MKTLPEMLPTHEEVAIAQESSRELSVLIAKNAQSQTISVTDANGITRSVDLPVSSLQLLVSALLEIGKGNAVKLLPIRAELTTQEAADLLNVSINTLTKLVDEKQIPHSQIGNTPKVRYLDLLAYQNKLRSDRLESLSELSKVDQKLGRYHD